MPRYFYFGANWSDSYVYQGICEKERARRRRRGANKQADTRRAGRINRSIISTLFPPDNNYSTP